MIATEYMEMVEAAALKAYEPTSLDQNLQQTMITWMHTANTAVLTEAWCK